MYEIGYIENDCLTIKKETKPTIRLRKAEFAYIKKNYLKIISFKYLITISLLGLLFWIDTFTAYNLNIANFIILLIFNRIIFFIHNNIRSRLNILTFFFLSSTKMIFPILLFINSDYYIVPIIFLILIFPLLRTIEVSTLTRHNFINLSKIISDIDKFRIIYLVIFLFFTLLIYNFSILNVKNFSICFSLIIYYLLFRIITFFLIKNGYYIRDKKTKINPQTNLK